MIPILYPANETAFTSNGLGGLNDAISCKVHEVLNGEYELTMEYPVTGIHFDDIIKTRLILAKPSPMEPPQPFEIYRIDKELSGIVTVYARHWSYRLSMIPVRPWYAVSPVEALLQIADKAYYTIPYQMVATTAKTGDMKVDIPMSVRGMIGEVIQRYGLEVKWGRDRIDLVNMRGSDNGVRINYGKNLTEFLQESDISETVTGILPYWTGMDMSGTGTGGVEPEPIILIGSIYIDPVKDANYPYSRVVPYDFQTWFPEGHVPTAQELNQAAVDYMANYQSGLPDETTNVSFIPLWLTEEFKDKASVERVSLGDTIRITSENINADITARVVEVTWDVLKDRYEDIITGKPTRGLEEQFTKANEKIEEETAQLKTDLQIAIDKATQMITGNSGGYIKFLYDANGKPYEMVVMDNEDITQAVNIWRFNQSGLGHSSNGYNGPYTLAMLMNGSINADMITAGSIDASLITTGLLDANIIRTGVIKDDDGSLLFDVDNATLTSFSENWMMIRDPDTRDRHRFKNRRVTTSGGDDYAITRQINEVSNPYVNRAGTDLTATIHSNYALLQEGSDHRFFGELEIEVFDGLDIHYYTNATTIGNILTYLPNVSGVYNLEVGNHAINRTEVQGDNAQLHGQTMALMGVTANNDWARAIFCTAEDVRTTRNGITHVTYNGQTSLTGKTVTIVNGLITNIVG